MRAYRAAAAFVVCAGFATGAARAQERGPADARVTVTEFCSYATEACARMARMVETALADRGDQVRFLFRYLSGDDGSDAVQYRAAVAAGLQGRFWLMHETLLANIDRGSRADAVAIAAQLGLDAARLSADIDSAAAQAAVQRDRNEAAERGVTATPAVFVNDRQISVKEAADLRAAIVAAFGVR